MAKEMVRVGDVWASEDRRAKVKNISKDGQALTYQRFVESGGLGREMGALVSSFLRGRKLVERDGRPVV